MLKITAIVVILGMSANGGYEAKVNQAMHLKAEEQNVKAKFIADEKAGRILTITKTATLKPSATPTKVSTPKPNTTPTATPTPTRTTAVTPKPTAAPGGK